ncbi:nitric oxide reductase transcriptional regulator NorR [Povalibacter sp.]|uniref:nitric oxide reductase transcriptional regulator NorR n=1 Tax=Povalibacter sp. TaxID=1962978 RepID=UPI002F3F0023
MTPLRNLEGEGRYAELLAVARALAPCDAIALLRLDDSVLVPEATEGLTEETRHRRFAIADHPRLARFVQSRSPVRLPADCGLPDPYDGLIKGVSELSPVHDCVGMPLWIDGELWGVLTFDALSPDALAPLDEPQLRRVEQLMIEGIQAITASKAASAHRRRAVVVPHAIRYVDAPRELIGSSTAMRQLLHDIHTVAPSDLTVLILGETGVGKELIAQRLHEQSPRRDQLLVHVNCAALPESLAESELFGHRKGAFTGAMQDRAGKFELADGGTLLLDEVGELPPSVQAKLLRALQSGEIQRPGSDAPLHVDVRVIAATNRDLRQEVSAGRFRADLFHRLSVFPLIVPPLRERGRDVLALAGAFLEENQRRLEARNFRLTPDAREALLAYDWPGNVRELEHTLSRAALRAVAEQGHAHRWIGIEPRHLALEAAGASEAAGAPRFRQAPGEPAAATTLREATQFFQREWISDALGRNDGSIAAAARAAGMDRGNFHRLMRRLGVRQRH